MIEQLLQTSLALSEAPRGHALTVLDIPESDQLRSFGIRPGKRLQLHSRQWFGGPFMVQVDGRYVAVDPRVAGEIRVHSAQNG